MKIDLSLNDKIEVGDLIEFDGKLCLIITDHYNEFYNLLNLDNMTTLELASDSIEDLLNQCSHKLIAKSYELKLSKI